MSPTRSVIANKLLKNMRPEDFDLLVPNLIKQEFAVHFEIEAPNTPISDVLFLENGLASMVAKKISGHDVEVGIVGVEGMTGSRLLSQHRRPLDGIGARLAITFLFPK